MTGTRSLRSRLVLSTVVLVALVMVVLGFGVHLVLEATANRDIDRVVQDRAGTVVSLVQGASQRRLTVPEDSLDPGVAVYDADGRRVAGSLDPRAAATAADLITTDRARTVDVAEAVRLRAVPFTTGSGESGVVVVGLEVTPYERSETYGLAAVVVLGVVVVALAGGIAWRITGQALAPVADMARRAAEWSEHDLGHRFGPGPPTRELAELGATLDRLLDRVARALRSEQRLTGELAHELRTPLTAVQGSAEIALLRGGQDPATRADLEEVAAAARAMAASISSLLDLARDRMEDASGTCTVAELVAGASPTALPPGIELVDRTADCEARVAAPVALGARSLAPLVDNALRHARGRVELRVEQSASVVRLSVGDDGPGVPDHLRDHVFEPGVSGDDGTGLGLGIARRVARSLGGDVDLATPAPGATFVLTLPRA